MESFVARNMTPWSDSKTGRVHAHKRTTELKLPSSGGIVPVNELLNATLGRAAVGRQVSCCGLLHATEPLGGAGAMGMAASAAGHGRRASSKCW